nr:STOREKEEPER protein-like [Coffea arabica]
MESKKPTTHYPPPSTQSEEEESEKGQDEESREGEEGSEEESKSEHKEESEEEERSEGEEFEVEENIHESPTQLDQMFSAQKEIITPYQSSSDSGEEEDKEGGDDEELEISTHSPTSDFMIKLIPPTKFTSKGSSSTSKRPLEDQGDDQKHLRSEKKAKGKADEPNKQEPSAISAAIGEGAGTKWSDDDVKCLLRSIIKFKTEKGLNPSTNMNAFCKYVKGKFGREFSRSQIYEKIRRLKSKGFNSVEKFEKGGDCFVHFNANELEIFKLSKSIWGAETGDGTAIDRANETVKSMGKVVSFVKQDKKEEKKKKTNVVKTFFRDDAEDDFQSKYPYLTKSFDVDSWSIMMNADKIAGQRSFLKENMSLIGHAKAMELEDKWKKLREAEVELLLKRSELMKEHCTLVLEVFDTCNRKLSKPSSAHDGVPDTAEFVDGEDVYENSAYNILGATFGYLQRLRENYG